MRGSITFKSRLPRKDGLSDEAVCQKLLGAKNAKGGSYPKLAYELMGTLEEWLKKEKEFCEHKATKCFVPWQFYERPLKN